MSTLNKTAKTATTEKYTEEQTKKLLAAWDSFCQLVPNWATTDRSKADAKIEELAEQFEKKTRSIIAKLTRHERYVSKTKTTAASVTTKSELAQAIGKVLGMSVPEIESLTMAGKVALQKILNALAASVPVEVLTPQAEAEKNAVIDEIAGLIELEAEEIRDLSRLQSSTLIGILGSIKDIEQIANGFSTIQATSQQA